jgi:putative tricarboxylic transport membrane protein
MVNRGEVLLAMLWILIGFLVTVESFRLGIGHIHKPGSGMMPFLLGVIFMLISLRLLLSLLLRKSRREGKAEKNIWAGVSFWRMGLVMLSLVGYGMVLERIGFSLATACCLFILFKFAGSEEWKRSLILTCLTVVFAHLLFVTLLRMEMPSFPWEVFF